ncbi:GrpE nucleotide exchange factor [Sesbania bispinosa]|nr:GrpE nucleotide exchange factor [Sesbania bispinosa]
MAAFLSNQSLLGSYPCSTSSLSSKPFHTRQPKIVRFPSRPCPSNLATILGFPTPLSRVNRRALFKSLLASQNSLHPTSDETEETQNDVTVTDDDEDKKPLPSLLVLIEAYKEAFQNGDEETVSQIEERIHSMENEKNKLIQTVSTLSANKVTSKEKYLRLQAEFDNFRKRSDKERINIQSDAQQEVIEKLLLMVDNFEQAKQQIKATTEKEKRIDASYQGIYKQFVEIMKSHHVSVVATVGKPFNPLLHEAIAREESLEYKEGIIIKECKRGFLLRDQVLRPALVKVSLGPGNKKSPVTPAKSMEQPSTAAGIDER